MEENDKRQPGPAETYLRKKLGIQIMPNELTFFHERLFELMEEFAAEQIEQIGKIFEKTLAEIEKIVPHAHQTGK